MAQNGIGAANAAYGGMNGVVMPAPGHYSDMQIMMENMEQLSKTLRDNREEWLQVQEGLARVERLQGKLARDGQLPLANGDTQLSEQELNTPTMTQLQHALDTANNRMADLEAHYSQQVHLQEQYSKTLSNVTESVRNWIYDLHEHIKLWHEHYINLVQQSRNETDGMRKTHQDWQGALSRLSEGVRQAYKAREEEGMPYKAKIAALKEENRILRLKAGWDPVENSDEDEWDEEEAEVNEGRGRGSRSSQPAGAEEVKSIRLARMLQTSDDGGQEIPVSS